MNNRLVTTGALALLALAIVSFANPASASTAPTSRAVTHLAGETPIPQSNAVLVGHVVWQGRPIDLQEMPLTLHLKQAQDPGAEATYKVEATDENGKFEVNVGQLPAGSYGWQVKGPQYLSNAGKVELGLSDTTEVEMGLMRTGDVNDDNVVNGSDFTLLRASFGKSIGQFGYDGRADFTGDQAVSISDFILLRDNFGLGGN